MEKVETADDEAKRIDHIAEKPGLYKLVFSNYHSWLRGKSLIVQYIVFTPAPAVVEVPRATLEKEVDEVLESAVETKNVPLKQNSIIAEQDAKRI